MDWGFSSCLATKVFCFPLRVNPASQLPIKKYVRNFCHCSYFVIVNVWGDYVGVSKKQA